MWYLEGDSFTFYIVFYCMRYVSDIGLNPTHYHHHPADHVQLFEAV